MQVCGAGASAPSMNMGSCGGAGQDAMDFQSMLRENPNTAYGASQCGQGAAMMSQMMGQSPTQSVGRSGMHGGMDHGSMQMGGMYGDLPAQHSGTDHLMQSGLMMQGHAMQDFNMNNTDGNFDLQSYISGNKYVVQDVAERVMEDNKGLAQRAANGNDGAINRLENKIAKELTNVNDIKDIENKQLRRAFIAEGESLGMTRKEMDHLLHTPLSETGVGSMIDRNSSISGSLHTVDLKRTRAEDMGNGVYEVHLVSNNGKNNAHDNMDISTFYTEADSAKEAKRTVNQAARRGDLDKDGRYNLTDAGMQMMMNNLAAYG